VIRRYRVFGGVLATTMDFPELEPAGDAVPTWTLDRRDERPPPFDGECIGDDEVYGSVRVRGFRGDAGLRLHFDDTGAFDIGADGTHITWFAPPDATLEAMRADVTGRVLAGCLHVAGTLSLHASAVSIGGSGIAFLAPKFHGKSTLATALVRAGAGLLTDDTLPVDLGRPPCLRPGVQRLRLWDDSAQKLVGAGPATRGTKHELAEVGEGWLEHARVAFGAAYLLDPVVPGAGTAAVRRVPVGSIEGTMAFVRFAKLASILGGVEAPRLLRLAGSVASAVPVYRLEIVRELDALDEIVAQLMTWHAEGARAHAPRSPA
jgi:hypothetical protein